MDHEDKYKCDHINIIDDTCTDCGEIFEEYRINFETELQHDDTFVVNKVKKEIFCYYNKLASLDIDPKIKTNVCRQIEDLKDKSHIRLNTHIKNLFVMIYIAYIQEQMEFNPLDIGKKLNLSDKEIRDSIKIVSRGIDDKGYKNPVCLINPFTFIKELSDTFKEHHVITEENLKKIEAFINMIMENNPMLGNENPKGIAASVLKLYYEQNKINIPDFLLGIGRTSAYIKNKENMIIKTLNSIE